MDLKSYVISCVLFAVPFTMIKPALPGQTDTEANPALAPEILEIIQGNQANLDALQTMQATITTVRSLSFGTRGARDLTNTEKVWYDGNHMRRDQLEGKFIGEETGRLLFGETSDGHKGYFDAPTPGAVEIRSVESYFYYVPQNRKVFIEEPETDKRRLNQSNPLLIYQTARGYALKDLILESAEVGQYFTVKSEKLDGDDCILLSCNYTTGPKWTLEISVVPSKGYCIRKIRDTDQQGNVIDEYTATVKEYAPGLWWCDTVRAESHRPWERVTDTIVELSVDSLVVNEPIEAQVFTLAGTDIPYGTKVVDKLTGLNYVYGPGFKMPDEDVDLAIEAVEKFPPEHQAAVDSADSSQNTRPNVTDQSDRGAGGDDADANKLSLAQSDRHVGFQNKLWLVAIIGLGIIAAVIALVLVKGRRLCTK